jgi:hypothetical protein
MPNGNTDIEEIMLGSIPGRGKDFSSSVYVHTSSEVHPTSYQIPEVHIFTLLAMAENCFKQI